MIVDSIRLCSASDSFCPPGPNTFRPLSWNALCDADTITPGQLRTRASRATAGVGITSSSMASAPAEATPAETAAASMEPDRRVSTPITT